MRRCIGSWKLNFTEWCCTLRRVESRSLKVFCFFVFFILLLVWLHHGLTDNSHTSPNKVNQQTEPKMFKENQTCYLWKQILSLLPFFWFCFVLFHVLFGASLGHCAPSNCKALCLNLASRTLCLYVWPPHSFLFHVKPFNHKENTTLLSFTENI